MDSQSVKAIIGDKIEEKYMRVNIVLVDSKHERTRHQPIFSAPPEG